MAAQTVTSEDTNLVRLAQAGDRDAFTELYRKYVRVVHGILLAHLPSNYAEDQAQEVFITVFSQLPNLREPSAFSSWLCTIARNRATDFLRARVREQRLEEDLGTRPGCHSAEAAEALAAIRALPDAYRETLLLRLVEGLTGPEIAERTGLTHGSVRVNLHRGMEILRRALGKELTS